MTRKHVLALLLITVLAAGSLSGQVYFQYMGLEQTPKHSGRSLSLGGSALALEQDPVAGLHNPAALFTREDALSVHAGLDLSAFTERRSFPVQDSFGDFLAENDYVSNRFQKWGGDMALYYSQEGFSASAGWFTLENLRYDYREEIRSDLGTGTYDRDPLAGLHKVSFSGLLHGFNIALAHDIGEHFALGYSYTRLFGSGMEEGFGVIPILNDNKLSSSDTTYFPAELRKASGSNVNLGLTADITKRLRTGFHVEMNGIFSAEGSHILAGMDSSLMLPAYTADPDSAYKMVIDRPNTYSLSLRYIPENELKTTIYAQLDLTNWRGYSTGYFNSADSLVSLFDPDYAPAWTVRAGVEHVFFTGMPIRFGFVYEQNPMGNEMDRSTIHFGSGWISDALSVDVGLAIYQNMYYYKDLFPVEGEVREYLDKVKESNVRANISLSYAF